MATKPATKTAALKKPATTASTAVAVKKPSGGNIVSIQEALKAQAAGLNDRTELPGGNKIKLEPGLFKLPDGTDTAGPLELVIVDFTTVHRFYPSKFDRNNIVPPACFALGPNPKQMTPSKNSPERQADSCQGCPNNEFGSDGDGKACKNGRLLAVLPPDADEDTPLWLLEVSPTAIKGFDSYVQSVARTFGMPPIAVVTSVSLDDTVAYAKLKFDDPQPNEQLSAHYARQAEAQELLATEPDVSGYEKPVKAPARKAGVARR